MKHYFVKCDIINKNKYNIAVYCNRSFVYEKNAKKYFEKLRKQFENKAIIFPAQKEYRAEVYLRHSDKPMINIYFAEFEFKF